MISTRRRALKKHCLHDLTSTIRTKESCRPGPPDTAGCRAKTSLVSLDLDRFSYSTYLRVDPQPKEPLSETPARSNLVPESLGAVESVCRRALVDLFRLVVGLARTAEDFAAPESGSNKHNNRDGSDTNWHNVRNVDGTRGQQTNKYLRYVMKERVRVACTKDTSESRDVK